MCYISWWYLWRDCEVKSLLSSVMDIGVYWLALVIVLASFLSLCVLPVFKDVLSTYLLHKYLVICLTLTVCCFSFKLWFISFKGSLCTLWHFFPSVTLVILNLTIHYCCCHISCFVSIILETVQGSKMLITCSIISALLLLMTFSDLQGSCWLF